MIEIATGVVEPATGVVAPAMGVVEPTTGMVEPATGAVEPATGVVEPATSLVERATGLVEPIRAGVNRRLMLLRILYDFLAALSPRLIYLRLWFTCPSCLPLRKIIDRARPTSSWSEVAWTKIREARRSCE